MTNTIPDLTVRDMVRDERARQVGLWGEQNHPDGTSAENTELANLARESADQAAEQKRLTWLDILMEEVLEAAAEPDEDALITELIQVAAVAESWADSIRRRQAGRLPTTGE